MIRKRIFLGIIASLVGSLLGNSALAAHKAKVSEPTIVVKMYQTALTGNGLFIGTIKLTETPYGVMITPSVYLTPGLHGFHVHENPSCEDMGMAAGGHLDPEHTGKHAGPYSSKGHVGDLPVLYVNKNGVANLPSLAPRLKLADLRGHALMIHFGGDNYADYPQKLGGGAARIACGVIK
jgi:Cu-Zn family superoxide dismutase